MLGIFVCQFPTPGAQFYQSYVFFLEKFNEINYNDGELYALSTSAAVCFIF